MVAVCACVHVVTTYHIRYIGAFPLPKLHGQGHLHSKIPPAQLCIKPLSEEIIEPEAEVVDSESIHPGKVLVQSTHPGPQPCPQGISTYLPQCKRKDSCSQKDLVLIHLHIDTHA